MTSVSTSPDLRDLRAAVSGAVVGAADPAYDTARQAWNLAADQRPSAVVLADDVADVAATIRFAREHGLRVAPQGTGHGAGALGPLDGVILLRTLRMGGVAIDPDARTARAEAGAVWADVAAAAGAHGLAGLGGSSPTVGVVGYSLGGGIGWLARRHGLACNSVTAVELVTAGGEHVRATADTDAELFWALRGGGGSFGVVTAIEFALQPLATVRAGSVMFDAEHAPALFAAYRELAAEAPDDLSSAIRFLTLPPLPAVPEPLRGRPLVDVIVAGTGPDPLAALRAIAEPVVDTVAEIPAANLCRIAGDPEPPTPAMEEHLLLDDLPVEALVEVAGPGSGSPLLMVAARQLGGALGRAPEGAGALATLDGAFVMNAVGIPAGPDVGAAVAEHFGRVREALAPWSTGRQYLNFAGTPGDASGAFDEDTYARLRAVREAADPDGLIVSNHPVA